MHHKFLVFLRSIRDAEDPYHDLHPYAIWTGSYNPTANASRSLENAIYVESSDVANFYMSLAADAFVISEPLNWDHPYADELIPRYGT